MITYNKENVKTHFLNLVGKAGLKEIVLERVFDRNCQQSTLWRSYSGHPFDSTNKPGLRWIDFGALTRCCGARLVVNE
jgi:hypothetical protein